MITLSQAIQNARKNSNALAAGRVDEVLSAKQTKALFAKYLPQVSAQYSYLYNPILQTSILPIGVFNPTYPIDATKSVQFGTKWTQTAGISATQTILDFSIKKLIHESKLQERLTNATQEQATYELAYTIAQTYIDIYLAEAKIKSLIADTNRTYLSYTLLKNKYDEKRLLLTDLNKSKINHNNSVQLLSDGFALLVEHQVYLLYLMGSKDVENSDFQIDTTFFMKALLINTEKRSDSEHFPDLELLTLKSALSQIQIKSERVKHRPSICFKGYLGANQFSNTFKPLQSDSWFGLSYLGLDVKLPLLFGENSNNKIQQLHLMATQSDFLKEEKKLQYKKDLVTSKIKQDNLQHKLNSQQENIFLSNQSIGIFQERLQEGQESAFTLNLEETNLQLLAAEYEISKRQLWQYLLDALKAKGRLSVLWN